MHVPLTQGSFSQSLISRK